MGKPFQRLFETIAEFLDPSQLPDYGMLRPKSELGVRTELVGRSPGSNPVSVGHLAQVRQATT